MKYKSKQSQAQQQTPSMKSEMKFTFSCANEGNFLFQLAGNHPVARTSVLFFLHPEHTLGQRGLGSDSRHVVHPTDHLGTGIHHWVYKRATCQIHLFKSQHCSPKCPSSVMLLQSFFYKKMRGKKRSILSLLENSKEASCYSASALMF